MYWFSLGNEATKFNGSCNNPVLTVKTKYCSLVGEEFPIMVQIKRVISEAELAVVGDSKGLGLSASNSDES